MTPSAAYQHLVRDEIEQVPIHQLANRVLATGVVPYPPGIPVLMPGERVDAKGGPIVRFLQAVGNNWNISLFHYRNHGSDYGRVLAGIEVPKAEREDFLLHLNDLHYPYSEETANPAYRMFLGGG